MSIEENKAIVRRLVEEATVRGRLEVMDELVAEDYVDHTPWPGFPPNRDGFKQSMAQYLSAFGDVEIEIYEMIGEGDKVALIEKVTGTHKGEMAGVPPSGKRVGITSMSVYRIADGKIVESWDLNDSAAQMTQ